MKKEPSLIENISLMWFVNFFKLATPIILIPWLTRILDSETFGFYMYSVAFAAWLSILIDYGFGFSGTRTIAKNKDNNKFVSKYLNAIISAKILISSFLIFICILFYFISPIFRNNISWLFISFFVAILISLVPLYYFQGKETLRKLGIIEATINILNVILVLSYVKGEEDIPILFLLMILPRFFIVIISYIVIFYEIDFRPKLDFRYGLEILYKGFYFALFQITNGIYTSFNVIFLAFFVSPTLVGVYATCERIIRVFITFIGQAAHIVFPRIISLSSLDMSKMKTLRNKSLYGFLFLGIISAFALYLFSSFLSEIFLPNQKTEFIAVLRYMLFALIPISISTVYYSQYFLLNNDEKILSFIIIFCLIFNFIFGYFMIMNFGVKGMAITWPIVEMLVLALCILIIHGFLGKRSNFL